MTAPTLEPGAHAGVPTVQHGGAVAVANAGPLLTALARAAADPATDMDKMERLFAMHQAMVKDEREAAFNAAMSRAQGAMEAVVKNRRNDQTNSNYADLATINAAIKPIYTEHGFSISFDTADAPQEGYLRLVAILSHKDGHSRNYHLDMPPDDVGIKGSTNKTKVHATGSTNTYARRYLTCMAFNITTEDDNDGNRQRNATAGALGALSAKRRQVVTEIAAEVRELMANDKAFDGYSLCETSDLDGEEKIALWSLFDSRIRSTLKAMGEAERAKQPISEAARRRLEAIITENGLDREALKKWCGDTFSKEHFNELTQDEYRRLDEYMKSANGAVSPKAAQEHDGQDQNTTASNEAPADEHAPAAAIITPDEAMKLEARCTDNNIAVGKVKKAFAVERLSMLTADQLVQAHTMIDTTIQQRKDAAS